MSTATALRRVSATRYVTPLREGGSLPGLVEADDMFRNASTTSMGSVSCSDMSSSLRRSCSDRYGTVSAVITTIKW